MPLGPAPSHNQGGTRCAVSRTPNVVASLALFIALGGGAYAAAKLPKNSVGPTQLRKNAVTSSKVKNHSLHRQDLTDAINLPVQAPVPLDPTHVDVAGGIDDPGGVCTGSYANPTAAAGYACIYPSGATNAKNLQATVPGGMSTPLGFAVQYFGVATGYAELSGSWAYTAP
jgi:hypothetical protein